MKLLEDIKPITYMRTRPVDLVRQVVKNRRPVVITQRGKPKVVLRDILSYKEEKRAMELLMLSIKGIHK